MAQELASEKLIERSIYIFGIAEALHLAGLFKHVPVSSLAGIALPAWLAAVVLFAVKDMLDKKKKKKQQGAETEPGSWKNFQKFPYRTLLFYLIAVLQTVWFLMLQTPEISGDITGETVQTFLAENAVYNVNPMTGSAFTQGMPARFKILGLPTFYALFCRLTGCPAVYTVYRIMPLVTFILAYVVYGLWARFLFPKDYKKQITFLLVIALLFQFGCYGTVSDGARLFTAGWRGETIRALILLPYALLCLMKKRKKGVLLCILAEACMVWTLYGVGLVLLMTVIVEVIRYVNNRRHMLLRQNFKKEGGV